MHESCGGGPPAQGALWNPGAACKGGDLRGAQGTGNLLEGAGAANDQCTDATDIHKPQGLCEG
eukprot:3035464-Alexandrium_andersonii.AAC.1